MEAVACERDCESHRTTELPCPPDDQQLRPMQRPAPAQISEGAQCEHHDESSNEQQRIRHYDEGRGRPCDGLEVRMPWRVRFARRRAAITTVVKALSAMPGTLCRVRNTTVASPRVRIVPSTLQTKDVHPYVSVEHDVYHKTQRVENMCCHELRRKQP